MNRDNIETLDEFYNSDPPKLYAKRIKRANHMVFLSLRKHALEGREAGGFVTYALQNNLQMTVGKADDKMRHHIRDIVLYLSNPYIGNAWGSEEIVKEWKEREGLVGIYGEQEALRIAIDRKL